MKRYLFLMLIALNAMVSYAYDFEVDGIAYNLLSIENNTVEVANTSKVAGPFDGTDRVLVIPASININGHELTVVSIGKEAVRCRYSGLFSEIYLPETIETIGNSAFYDQNIIEKVELPQSLKRIDKSAFSGCIQLEEVDLPESVEYIGSYAFSATGIRTFKFPNSVKEIGICPFENCNNLEDVDLESLRPMGYLSKGLLSKSSVRRVVIPDWVRTIPEDFMDGCENIEELEFGTMAALERIGINAFRNCKFQNPIILPNGVKTIDINAFRYCSFYNSIVLPDGLKTIGDRAFEQAEMEGGTLIVPSSVEKVGYHVFALKKLDSLIFLSSDARLYYSSNYTYDQLYINDASSELNFLRLDRGIYKNIEGQAFEAYFYNAKVVEMSDAFLRSQTERRIKYFLGVERLVILEGVENLDYYFKCENTNSILLPSTLKTIKASNFKETTNLTNVDCRAQEPPLCDGKIFADILYTKAKLTVPLGCKEAYQNAEGWKYFWDIEESEVPVYDGSQNDIKAVMQDDVDWFSISDGGNKAAERLEIYSLDGRMVKRVERGEDVDSLHGLYIIKCGSKTAKVML